MKYLYQFIPKRFEYLLNAKIIEFDDKRLKTDYIINIIHELLVKYFFSEEIVSLKINLWSVILRKNYGMNYNYYINYLLENGFIKLVSDYYVSKKSKTYIINYFDIEDVIRVKIYDKILIKKHTRGYLERSITDYSNNQIPINIKKKLVNDLYHIKVDVDKSLEYLKNLKEKGDIDNIKYYKNLSSIYGIKDGNIFFKFDNYGRFHSNFTILKKEIRRKYLKIGDSEVCEIDIKNSQPLFLFVLMCRYMNKSKWLEYDDVERYFFVVKSGLIYDDILNKYKNIKTRDDAKILVYKTLFGKNGKNSIFKDLYPTVFNFIKKYKEEIGDHKSISHELQKIESEFIFNNVIGKIVTKNPSIKLCTVHDSIIYPCEYKSIVESIFNEEISKTIK